MKYRNYAVVSHKLFTGWFSSSNHIDSKSNDDPDAKRPSKSSPIDSWYQPPESSSAQAISSAPAYPPKNTRG